MGHSCWTTQEGTKPRWEGRTRGIRRDGNGWAKVASPRGTEMLPPPQESDKSGRSAEVGDRPPQRQLANTRPEDSFPGGLDQRENLTFFDPLADTKI